MANNWAIIIGINHYEHHPEQQLKYAVPDARLIYEFLSTQAGFAPDQILLCLGDEAHRTSPNYPTYATLLRLLNRDLHPSRIGQVDRLWFFFGGHGVSQNGRDYLLTADSLIEDVELKIALPIDEVIASLRKHQTADIVLVLDNCRQLQGSRKLSAGEVGKQTIELAQSRGITTIFSCDYGQYSFELDSVKQGAFTYALVEGLKQHTLPDQLEQYLRRRVAELNQRRDQVPRIRVEPASKALQPLLPSAVTAADITVLVERAREVELEEDFETAKQLWWQVTLAQSDEHIREARTAIERINQKINKKSVPHPPPPPPVEASNTRRLDAAMPKVCRVGQETEVRVMIALPDSVGLKNYLPDYTEAGDLISKGDVNRNTFPLTFPKDPVTGEPQPTTLFISITARSFAVEQAIKGLYLSPDQDSGVVTFFMMPQIKRSRARVRVEVFKDEQRAVLLGSLSLVTKILEQQSAWTQAAWRLVKLPLNLLDNYSTTRQEASQRVYAPIAYAPLDTINRSLLDDTEDCLCDAAPLSSNFSPENNQIGEESANSLPLCEADFETVTVDKRGQMTKRFAKRATLFKEDLGNGVILEMVQIPGGSFKMGSPETEKGRSNYESPQRTVNVSSFFMGKFTVTQAQYQQIMGRNPAIFKGEKRPVENVSWNDAVEFCAKLSQRTGRTYRLPSEAEWEYACRARTTTPFHFGQTVTSALANYDASKAVYGSEPKGEYRGQTTEVGSFPPNAFGLYDMHGNVWEWCQDHWHENYQGAPNDGSAWLSEDKHALRLLRGGSWYSGPRSCRSACRNHAYPATRSNLTGFRVVCVPPRTV
ncbi:SUMF1/EgtB/PvdO family nonheme iron enzyme [Leptolyngbya sp. NK1-12]|uniref:SUMF1/EgtB/PvdO family nonheme iron enzyme n=1 Tax=Leptolyngbya sp. NK1-12 TaxID=2547451 RepID=A0AA96WE12_9CYAN|nr:SUMF1/EgtB/PvdO family nonheme iron enzyme [Leptolyngbya sp. NK1-12]